MQIAATGRLYKMLTTGRSSAEQGQPLGARLESALKTNPEIPSKTTPRNTPEMLLFTQL